MTGLRFRVKYPTDNTDLYCGSRPFRGQQTMVFKAGQISGTSFSDWKDESCASTRQNETHWTIGDSPGVLERKIQKMDESGSVRRNKTTGSGRECRARSQGYTISIHVKRSTARKSGQQRKGGKASSHAQTSCARSTHEDEGYLQTATSKSADPVVGSDTTDGTPDADSGFSSDMMAKPQSVVKLRRLGALLNEVVLRVRDCIARW